jgi:hypothetical protein
MPGNTRQKLTPAVIKNLSSEYDKCSVAAPIMWEKAGVEIFSNLNSHIQIKMKNAKCM